MTMKTALITSAISYVTSEDMPVLYTLDGHGEKELSSDIQEDIQKANIDIKSLNLITEESVPEDAACLLINAPTSDISETEKDAIIEYLENGGKAMIFSDYTPKSLPFARSAPCCFTLVRKCAGMFFPVKTKL